MKRWTCRQWLGLLALSLSVFMISLDVTAVTVALPAIQRHLGLTFERLQWVVTAYALSFGALLMAGGTLADRFGRRRIFAIGGVVFALASVACGLAGDGTALIAARVVQGIGAAFMSGSGAALVAGTFEGCARPLAHGVRGAALGLGLAFGPALGGLVTAHLGWHWIFLANVPVTLGVVVAVMASVAEARNPAAHTVDLAGMAVFSTGLGVLMFALGAGPHLGWTSMTVSTLCAACAGCMVLFPYLEARHPHPLFDLRLFRLPAFAGVSIVPVAASVGYWSILVYLPLFLDRAWRMDPVTIGTTMLPFTLPMLVMPPLAARIARGVAPRQLFAGGLVLIAMGDWALAANLSDYGPIDLLFAPLLTAGLGAGLIDARITSAARAGMAAGIGATMRQVGYGLGIAGLGAVLGSATRAALAHTRGGMPAAGGVDAGSALLAFEAGRAPAPAAGDHLAKLVLDAYIHGMQVMLAVGGGVALLGAAAAWFLMRGSANEAVGDTTAAAPSD